MIRAEIGGDVIRLRLPFLRDEFEFGELLARVKATGATYRGGAKVWVLPLSLGSCRKLRAEFKRGVQFGPELAAWGRAELARERTLAGALRVDPRVPAELPRVRQMAPTMHAAMQRRGFQTVAARFGGLAGAHGNLDEMGLGKSIETFGALIEAGVAGRGMITAPRNALTATWIPEIEKWLSDVPGDVYVMLGNVKDRAQAVEQFFIESRGYTYAFFLCNPQMLDTRKEWRCGRSGAAHEKPKDAQACPYKKNHKMHLVHRYPILHETEWDFLIGDELHKYLIRSKRKNPTMFGLGLQTLRVRAIPGSPSGMRIGLTGSPTKGRPKNLFPIMAWIRPDRYTSQWKFSQDYLDFVPNRFTPNGVEFLDRVRPGRQKAFDREMDTIFIRRTADELHKLNPDWAPPPIAYYEKWIPLGDGQARQYAEMRRDAAAAFGEDVLTADNALAQLTRLKQFASAEWRMDSESGVLIPVRSNKSDWFLEEFLDGIGDAKCIVASQFTRLVDFYSDRLQKERVEHFVVTGRTDPVDTHRFAQRFQKPGGPQLFLVNTGAGGVSLTLDAADYVVIMDETFDDDDQRQVIKRAHRTSRVDHSVKAYFVRSEGTVEREIADLTAEKDWNVYRVLDRSRGLEYVRRFGGRSG